MRFSSLALASLALVSTATAYTFNNILVIMFENTRYEDAIADVNFKKFAKEGILYSNWTAQTHPSRGNYVYLSSGSLHGIDSDALIPVQGKNIVDLLEKKGYTWRSYEEGFPGDCYNKATSGHWAEKHSLAYVFANVKNDPRRCANIVEAGELAKDIKKKRIVNYAMYTPDLNNDGHDTDEVYAGKWLKQFLASTPVVKTFDVVLLTFDESTPDNDGNHIYTAVQGKAVGNPGTVDNTHLTHASLLKTLELNFGLGDLGTDDVHATPFSIW